MDSTEFVEKHLFIKHKHDGTPNGGPKIPPDYFVNLYISGKLGVGTTSPSCGIDVYGSQATIRVNGDAGTGAHMFLAVGGTNYSQWVTDGNNLSFDYPGSLYFRSGVDGTLRATLTSSGSLSLSAGIVGKTDGSTPASGIVGEYAQATAGPVNFTTSENFGTIASLTLSAGTWYINAQLIARGGGATITGAFAIWLDTGNGLTIGKDYLTIHNTNTEASATIAGYKLVITSSTTIYLKGRASYSAGQPTAYGHINATRMER